MVSMNTQATRAIRFATAAHVINWVVALSPISIMAAPVTDVVWIAVPFTYLIGLSLVVMARRFEWSSLLLMICSIANVAAISSMLLAGTGGLRSVSPMSWIFLASSLALPLIGILVASRLAEEPTEEWQPSGSAIELTV
jgi:hypothetical protein